MRARRHASLNTDREKGLARNFCHISRYEVRTLPKGIRSLFLKENNNQHHHHRPLIVLVPLRQTRQGRELQYLQQYLPASHVSCTVPETELQPRI